MNENKSVLTGLKALVVLFSIMAFCMVWVAFNSQTIANEAMMKALDAIAEMEVITETTTTQTVEGDSAIINNSNFEQYNDNSSNAGGDS